MKIDQAHLLSKASMTPSPLHHPFSIHTRETHFLLLPSPNLGWGTHPCLSLGRAALWKVSDSGFGGSDYFLRGSWRSVDKTQASWKDFQELLSKAGRSQQGALPWGLCAEAPFTARCSAIAPPLLRHCSAWGRGPAHFTPRTGLPCSLWWEKQAPLFQIPAPPKCAESQLHKNSSGSEECLTNQGPYFSRRGTHLQSCLRLSFCNVVWLLWDTRHCADCHSCTCGLPIR